MTILRSRAVKLTVFVHVGQVNLIAEQHEPLVELYGREHHTVRRLPVFTVVIERLEQQLRGRSTGEVQPDDLKVRQGAEGREQGHGLTRPRRTTEDLDKEVVVLFIYQIEAQTHNRFNETQRFVQIKHA